MTQLFLTFIMALTMGLLSAHLAEKKGRLYFWWFVMGVFFGIFALLFLFFLPPLGFEKSQKNGQSDQSPPVSDAVKQKQIEPQQEEKEWFYLDREWTQCGPVTFGRIQELYCFKQIDDDSYLWHPTMKDWQQCKEIDLA